MENETAQHISDNMIYLDNGILVCFHTIPTTDKVETTILPTVQNIEETRRDLSLGVLHLWRGILSLIVD